MTLSWNFSATSHDKGIVDGIGERSREQLDAMFEVEKAVQLQQ